jgi:hypothetical protein
MPKFVSSKTYSLVTGLLLFAFGVVGFAFRNNFNLADKYLLLSLILGFWGVICAFD